MKSINYLKIKAMKKLINKQKSHAFGKDIYLLFRDESGQNYWLEAPLWDCGWYWGFGYIETYTNNRHPHLSRDISGHQHFSGFVGYQEKYNHEKGCFVKTDYIHNIYDNPTITETTFTQSEGWQLSELFKQFYLLQDMAEFCHNKPAPGCHITTVDVGHPDMTGLYKQINEVLIPNVTAKILQILSPV